MSKCVTGKVVYETKELAEEALIQHHIRNDYKEGQGPLNIYECRDCGNWHFTSKGETHELLKDSEVQRKIRNERRALDWERRFK